MVPEGDAKSAQQRRADTNVGSGLDSLNATRFFCAIFAGFRGSLMTVSEQTLAEEATAREKELLLAHRGLQFGARGDVSGGQARQYWPAATAGSYVAPCGSG